MPDGTVDADNAPAPFAALSKQLHAKDAGTHEYGDVEGRRSLRPADLQALNAGLVTDSPHHLMSVKLLDAPQAAVVIKDSVGAEITARAFYFTAIQSGSEGSCDKLEAPLITCFARVRDLATLG